VKYVPPIGASDNASYIDGNPSVGLEGSPVPAAAIEHPMREIMTVIEAAGLLPSSANLTQLLEAIQILMPPPSGGGGGGGDGGGGDGGGGDGGGSTGQWNNVTSQRSTNITYTNSMATSLNVRITWIWLASQGPALLVFRAYYPVWNGDYAAWEERTISQSELDQYGNRSGMFQATVPAGGTYEFTVGANGQASSPYSVLWEEFF
jgi:hypothetical protein